MAAVQQGLSGFRTMTRGEDTPVTRAPGEQVTAWGWITPCSQRKLANTSQGFFTFRIQTNRCFLINRAQQLCYLSSHESIFSNPFSSSHPACF